MGLSQCTLYTSCRERSVIYMLTKITMYNNIDNNGTDDRDVTRGVHLLRKYRGVTSSTIVIGLGTPSVRLYNLSTLYRIFTTYRNNSPFTILFLLYIGQAITSKYQVNLYY